MSVPLRTMLLLLLFAAPALAGEATIEDRLDRADAEVRDHEYRAAEKILRSILEEEPANRDALLGLARALRGVGEYPTAIRIYEGLIEADADDARPHAALALMAVFLDRKDEARRRCEAALERNPEYPTALATLARLEIEEARWKEAHGHLTKAEKLDPENLAVLGARSEYFYRTKDMGAATRLLRKILEIDPGNIQAHVRIARGFREPGRPHREPPAVPLTYATAAYSAIRKYRALDLEGAAAAFRALDGPECPDARPAFYLGLIELRRGRVRAAIGHLRRALDRDPEDHLVRNALATAWRVKVRIQRAEYGGGPDGVDRLRPLATVLPVPEVGDVDRYVRGYSALLPAERRVVLRTIAPMAAYLPGLIREGVRHDILGFEEGITEAKERQILADRRTLDGRWYGGLRGLEGKFAATGIEALLDAAVLDYDTFAHEFAHQIHRYALTSVQKSEIKGMYVRAKKAGHCLDSYAATNEWEYFAQGYEAFVSLVKSPFRHSFRRHTRAELRERDPDLYAFIRGLTGTPDPDPTLAPLAPKAIAFYEWADDAIARERAMRFFTPPK